MSYSYRTPASGSSGTILFLIVMITSCMLVFGVMSGTFLFNSKSECQAMGDKYNLTVAVSSSGECYTTGCKPGYSHNDDGDCV